MIHYSSDPTPDTSLRDRYLAASPSALQTLAVTMVLLCGPMDLGEAVRTLMSRSSATREACSTAIGAAVKAEKIRTRKATGGVWTIGPK